MYDEFVEMRNNFITQRIAIDDTPGTLIMDARVRVRNSCTRGDGHSKMERESQPVNGVGSPLGDVRDTKNWPLRNPIKPFT